MQTDIANALAQMYTSVAQDSLGDLALGWRLRLWSIMSRVFGEGASFRRSVLAYIVARDLLALWTPDRLSCGPNLRALAISYPHNALASCRRYLERVLSNSELHRICIRMQDDYDRIGACIDDMRLEFVCEAVLSVFHRVTDHDDDMYNDRGWYNAIWVNDGHLQIRDVDLGEITYCETHYWASREAGFTDVDHEYDCSPENYEKRRAFWQRWLRQSVPKVLGPIEEVHALLE